MAPITGTAELSPAPTGWRRIAAVSALSLLVSGTGQLLNRQPRKGIFLALVSFLLGSALVYTRVLLSFSTMIASLCLVLGWKIFVVGDAANSAAKLRRESPVRFPKITYALLTALMIAGAMFPSPELLKTKTGFAAFKIPSRSMCPTLCLGDRVVVDLNAYSLRPPNRGDLVVLKHPTSDALFVKRVIAIAGDTVSPGPNDSVIVNGTRFQVPVGCAAPTWDKSEPADYSEFTSTTVRPGDFFVIGDNLDDSLDSRLSQFGNVTADMFRGKPLFLILVTDDRQNWLQSALTSTRRQHDFCLVIVSRMCHAPLPVRPSHCALLSAVTQ